MFQIAKLETRERHFREVERHFEAKVKERTDVPSHPEEHHHISYSQRDYVSLSTLLTSKKDDPAYEVSHLTRNKFQLMNIAFIELPTYAAITHPSQTSPA